MARRTAARRAPTTGAVAKTGYAGSPTSTAALAARAARARMACNAAAAGHAQGTCAAAMPVGADLALRSAGLGARAEPVASESC